MCGATREAASRFGRVCVLSYRACLESHGCQENILSRDVISDVIFLKISVIARTIDDRGCRQKEEGD